MPNYIGYIKNLELDAGELEGSGKITLTLSLQASGADGNLEILI